MTPAGHVPLLITSTVEETTFHSDEATFEVEQTSFEAEQTL